MTATETIITERRFSHSPICYSMLNVVVLDNGVRSGGGEADNDTLCCIMQREREPTNWLTDWMSEWVTGILAVNVQDGSFEYIDRRPLFISQKMACCLPANFVWWFVNKGLIKVFGNFKVACGDSFKIKLQELVTSTFLFKTSSWFR